MKRLEGKVAIITGAGQGVGRGIALAFAKEGAAVVLAGRTESKVQAVAEEIRRFSGKALPIRCDVALRHDVEATVQATVNTFGTIHILVNNAFCGNDPIPIEQTTDEYFQAAVDTNLFGCLHFMQACFPYLKQNRGSIINFGTGAALEGWPNLITYVATKEAIRGMTRVAAKEWGKYGIRANCLTPQANSPAMETYRQRNPQGYAHLIAATPLGYIGDCEADIGPVAVFLASEDSRYMTGHTLTVDGGQFVLR
jgi:NAD(P)-dependent dehydrogenase (short-subunit alcohol dehydrogenase family)